MPHPCYVSWGASAAMMPQQAFPAPQPVPMMMPGAQMPMVMAPQFAGQMPPPMGYPGSMQTLEHHHGHQQAQQSSGGRRGLRAQRHRASRSRSRSHGGWDLPSFKDDGSRLSTAYKSLGLAWKNGEKRCISKNSGAASFVRRTRRSGR